MLYFHVRVALLKCDFLRVPCTESWTSWAQMKAENLRNSKMGLHVPIAASKLELLASKRNRAFFLGHPVKHKVMQTLYCGGGCLGDQETGRQNGVSGVRVQG